MRLVTLVLALAACGEVRQPHRWPDHRREKDAQIDALTVKTQELERKLQVLVTHMKRLEQQLARLGHAPGAVPSPGP
jgi:hypothetical protein